MKTYEYRGFDTQGRASRGLVEALSVKDARKRLAAGGVLAERVAPTGRRIAFSRERRATVYQELSALLGAGLPLVQALNVLIESPELSDAGSLLAGVRDRVREGSSLAQALAEASHSVTELERAVIEAAERTATVELMLNHLAAFLQEQARLRDRIQSALVYPALVLTVGICVAILMLGLLIPKTREIMAGANMPMPALTRFMIGFGKAALAGGAALGVALLAGGVYWRRRFRHEPELQERWDRFLFRCPVVGKGYAILTNVRFADTLSMLLAGGVPVMEGLLLAGRATGSRWVARLAESEAESVRHGDSLSAAVRRIPPLAPSVPGWIRTGEASGSLERLLRSAAEQYRHQWDRYLARSLSLLEPLLILVIGSFVLVVALSVLLPIMSISRSVGQ
jgi:general secretion pathway protein F